MARLDDATGVPVNVRRTGLVTLGLLVAVWLIDYIDRVMMSVALPFIGREFELTKTEQGALITAFAIAYMLTQIPGGMLADRFGPKRMLVTSLVLWSVFTALTGVVGGLVALLVVRVLFGVGQGLFPGAAFKAVAERTRPAQRASAAGVMLASNQLGAGIAPLIVAPLIMALGWRDTFLVVAAGGLAIGIALFLFLPRPLPAHLSEAPAANSQEGPVEAMPRGAVLRSPSVWKFAGLFCAVNMVGYGLITWVPSYLLEARGVSLTLAGVASAIPFLVGSLGMLLGGWLFDRYFHDRARVLVIPVLLVAAVLLVLMALSQSALEFTIYETLALGVAGLAVMSVLGMPVRALPTAVVGAGMGAVNVGGQLAGVIAPVVMGFLVDTFSYAAAFGFLVVSLLVGAVLALLVPQRPEQFKLAA